MKPVVKESILYALAWVVVGFAMWAIDPLLSQNGWIGFLIFILFSAGMVWLGIRERERRGGYLSYWPAWKTLLTITAIYLVITFVWQLLLTNVIDPDFQQNAMDAAMEEAYQDMKDSGMPDSQIEMSMEMTEKITGFMMKPAGQVIGIVVVFLFYMVLNFLLALIVRKEPVPGSGVLDEDI